MTSQTQLRYGFVSSGFTQHRLDDALGMIADAGYSGVGLQLDWYHLDPFADDIAAQVQKIKRRLSDLGLACVIETGARYLLDPKHKHEPTMVSTEGREKRIDLTKRAIAIAAELDAEAVSLWSGIVHDGTSESAVWDRLLSACEELVNEASSKDVTLAFEPEPGMFIDTTTRFDALTGKLGHPEALKLTLDIGHIRCNEPKDEATTIAKYASQLAYVQIDDMVEGAHEHLDFGEGEVDFTSTLRKLKDIEFEGLVAVELSRHSYAAHTMIPSSIEFLRQAEGIDL